ncbi:MAG TPA: Gfo/Idh/MocA family oxidoreductase [Gemmataceae bacterium]|nr:Gfo/Idh/MocA family oxidoreductase [Gemmataceae bacterium]
MPTNRREFFKTSAASLTALSALTVAGAADRANEKIVLAVMGVRNRGRDLLHGFSAFDDVEIAYICEVDENVVPAALKSINSRQKKMPKVEKDIRKVLEDKQVTAVAIAAPDHWHALATIWACQAGKDVYVEKPISHNLIEGRRMVEAARKHERVVQVGTQRRSAAHVASAAEFIRAGKLGKVPFARTWIAGNRPSIGHKVDGAVPAGVNYDLWLGPAPERPFNLNRFHYHWHWFWDYGTGEIGNNGIHALDVARWVLGLEAPARIACGGGKYFYDDDQQTPDTQIASFDFEHTCVTWEHRIWSKTGIDGQDWGVMLYGEKGNLIFDNNGWHTTGDVKASDKAAGLERPHLRNFLDCVKDRKRPNADIEEGHKSTRLCHLGNIAYRVGRTLRFDAQTETIVGDAEANKLLGRAYRKPFALPAG